MAISPRQGEIASPSAADQLAAAAILIYDTVLFYPPVVNEGLIPHSSPNIALEGMRAFQGRSGHGREAALESDTMNGHCPTFCFTPGYIFSYISSETMRRHIGLLIRGDEVDIK